VQALQQRVIDRRFTLRYEIVGQIELNLALSPHDIGIATLAAMSKVDRAAKRLRECLNDELVVA
jgi:hypothetical protein